MIIFRSFEHKLIDRYGLTAYERAEAIQSTPVVPGPSSVVAKPTSVVSKLPSVVPSESNGTSESVAPLKMTENVCSHMIVASGFPWNVTKKDIHDFFSGTQILNGDDGILITKETSMRAYVQFASGYDRRKALTKNRSQMKMRTIHVLKIDYSEFVFVASNTKQAATNVDNVIRVVGLPLAVNKQYILDLFKGKRVVFHLTFNSLCTKF